MKRVGIVGSRGYTNRIRIRDFVYKLKSEFGDKVEIISGGQPKGADGYAKKSTKTLRLQSTLYFR